MVRRWSTSNPGHREDRAAPYPSGAKELTVVIAAAHDLPRDKVDAARARGSRDWRWDAGVLVPFLGLYGWLAWIAQGQGLKQVLRSRGKRTTALRYVQKRALRSG
ncbi:MAG TPA: hypothetical protein VG454_10760 [Gemmatimonadales bacterium]|nr:hypothetical protein [Gemmatimonadales bacterium]